MTAIYLDNNATTRVDPTVAKTIYEASLRFPGNPSSIHDWGRQARAQLTRSRETIAKALGVLPDEIVFTSGGTEGLNTLIKGILADAGGHVITSDVEHSCVWGTLEAYPNKTVIAVGEYGAPTVDAVQEAIRPDTKLIVLMAVNNETGVMTDVAAIAKLAARFGIPFVVDGVAWFGKERVVIPKEGVSAVVFSGHKFHAPKGVGFMVVRKGLTWQPLFHGGMQEGGRRSGTENLPAIIGLAEAVVLAGLDEAPARMRRLRDRFEAKLAAALPDIVINGLGPRVSNTSNIAFLGKDGETLLMLLDRKGVMASHGSACGSGALEPSRILLNMGYSHDRARSSIRFSLCRYTTEEEIDRVASILISLCS